MTRIRVAKYTCVLGPHTGDGLLLVRHRHIAKKNWSQMTRSSEERTGTSTEPGDADADAPLIYCTPSESIGRSLLTLQASVPPSPHHCVKDSLCKTSDRLIRVLVEDCQWVVHWLCPFVARGSHMVRGVPCGKEEVDFHRFGAKLKFSISYCTTLFTLRLHVKKIQPRRVFSQ